MNRIGECWYLVRHPTNSDYDGMVFVVLNSRVVAGSSGLAYEHLCLYTNEDGSLAEYFNTEWEGDEPFDRDKKLKRVS